MLFYRSEPLVCIPCRFCVYNQVEDPVEVNRFTHTLHHHRIQPIPTISKLKHLKVTFVSIKLFIYQEALITLFKPSCLKIISDFYEFQTLKHSDIQISNIKIDLNKIIVYTFFLVQLCIVRKYINIKTIY